MKLTIDGQAKEVQSITDADCLDLNPWWERNLNSGKVHSGDIDLIQKTMLALFSLSRKDNPDQQTQTDTASKQAADSKKQTDRGKQKQKLKPNQKDTANNPAMYQFTETDAQDTANSPAMEQSTETDAQSGLNSFKDFLRESHEDGSVLETLITPFVTTAFGSEISDLFQTDKTSAGLKKFISEKLTKNIMQRFFPSIPKTKKIMQNKKDYLLIGDNVGDNVFRSFSFFFQHDSFPQMLPSCPNQSYIDLYSAEDQSSQTLIDIKKQQDYEAEVKVYRALEQLKGEKFTVIHGLKYSHYQFRMWESNHDAKKFKQKKEKPNCNNNVLHSDEGENDFVVLGPDYIVLIEVKNAVNEMSTESISNFVASGEKQIQKLMTIIKGIADESSTLGKSETDKQGSSDKTFVCKAASIRVYQFVAFPNINYKSIIGSDHIDFIFNSDLQDFSKWWQKK